MNSESQDDRACQEFQQRLPLLVEAGNELYRDPHLKTCAVCRALVIDLDRIADNARSSFGQEE